MALFFLFILLYLDMMLRTESYLATNVRMEPTAEEGKTKKNWEIEHITNKPNLESSLSWLPVTSDNIFACWVIQFGLKFFVIYTDKSFHPNRVDLSFFSHFTEMVTPSTQLLKSEPQNSLFHFPSPTSSKVGVTWRREREREEYCYSEVWS